MRDRSPTVEVNGLPHSGRVIRNKYVLEDQIGSGGMSVVWRVRHLSLGSTMAMKIMSTSGARAEVRREALLREARAAAKVQHRNVVRIYDVDTTEDGEPYILMEHLEGESLGSRLARTPSPSVEELLNIIVQALGGLATIHDAGLVHRDIKPENIFLETDAEGTLPKLLDFGLSREISLSESTVREGIIVGTPHYMSPEQAAGVRTLDLRSDLFGMGVVLYQGLSGQLPFRSDSFIHLLADIRDVNPAPLATLRPDLGLVISDVVEKAMYKDPGQRYQDAREMRKALEHAAATTVVLNNWVWTPY